MFGRYVGVLCLLLAVTSLFAGEMANVDDGAALIEELEYGEAFSVLQPLAAQGDARAQVLIGYMYQRGQGRDRDIHQAEYWYRQAAAQWDPNGLYMLGLLYINKDSGELFDQHRGFIWIRRAAHANNRYAQQFLIKSYTHGWLGLEVDPAKAGYWQEKYQANADS
jgi:TPR repeat protein